MGHSQSRDVRLYVAVKEPEKAAGPRASSKQSCHSTQSGQGSRLGPTGRTVQECLPEIAPELHEDSVSSTINGFLLGFSPQLVRPNPQVKQTVKTEKIATQSATNPPRGEIFHPVSRQRLSAAAMAEAPAARSARWAGQSPRIPSCGAGVQRWPGRLGTAPSALGTGREVPLDQGFFLQTPPVLRGPCPGPSWGWVP